MPLMIHRSGCFLLDIDKYEYSSPIELDEMYHRLFTFVSENQHLCNGFVQKSF